MNPLGGEAWVILPGGFCQGFSALFLKYCRDGLDFCSAFSNSTLNGANSAYLRDMVSSISEGGNSIYIEEDEAHYFEWNLDFKLCGTHIFGRGGRFRPNYDCGMYCSETTYYYMLQIHWMGEKVVHGKKINVEVGHTMAAVAKGGKCQFFDPNCGIVSISNGTLGDLFRLYFSDPRVKLIYAAGRQVVINVNRYSDLVPPHTAPEKAAEHLRIENKIRGV
jgi:hypothetical protein